MTAPGHRPASDLAGDRELVGVDEDARGRRAAVGPSGPTSIQRPARLGSRSNGSPNVPLEHVDEAPVGDGDGLALRREVVDARLRRGRRRGLAAAVVVGLPARRARRRSVAGRRGSRASPRSISARVRP